MKFSCSAVQQEQLAEGSESWVEGSLDATLCRAGLWCASHTWPQGFRSNHVILTHIPTYDHGCLQQASGLACVC